jgi:excisionase family DNA binding protein
MTASEREFLDAVVNEVKRLVEDAIAKVDELVERMESAANGQGQEWFTVRETAKMLGRSRYTIRQDIDKGKLDAVKVGGAGDKGEWRISRDAINRFRGPRDVGADNSVARMNPEKNIPANGYGTMGR